ncbi:MAG: T9SS type A sorting domain-containing protein [Psychroserpens sp.]|nr:T9SS type A sorting domain-containing protein [Psychroserpens sp.]
MIEVDPTTNVVKIKNFGSSDVDVTNYWFCHLFTYTQLNSGTIQSGDFDLSPGEEVVVQASSNFNASQSDLGLYSTSSFGSTTAMQDFLQWGAGGQGRENVAVNKGIWTAGTFVSISAPYEYTGDGNQNGFQFWDTLLGLDEFNGITKFSISPNPASTEFNVVLPDAIDQATVRVFDLLGKLIFKQKLINQQFSSYEITNWQTGLYLIKISTEDTSQTFRLIKQ